MENDVIAELFGGYIYEIRCNYTNQVYYGSSCVPFKTRMYKHKTLNTSSRDIIARGNYTAKVIENIIFKNKNELLMKERHYIQNNECVNKCIPIINKHEKKERVAELAKIWYKNHRESQIRKAAIWQKNNKERHNDAMHRYYLKNRDKLGQYQQARRQKQFDELNIKIFNNIQL